MKGECFYLILVQVNTPEIKTQYNTWKDYCYKNPDFTDQEQTQDFQVRSGHQTLQLIWIKDNNI